jgi:hypothetical protein
MSIPESQLETWAHQGAIAGSRDTYAAVKRCLESATVPYRHKDFKVFLQGSYANDTNVYAESDVDVVIRLDSTYYYDISALDSEAQAAYHGSTSPGTYSYDQFKSDVVATLRACFGSAVEVGKKAIAIDASGSRRKADVIVAAEFRNYRSFSGYLDSDYMSGVCFFTNDHTRVVNYPKQHSDNMTYRHQATNSWLKPSVRILKNMRRRMEADGLVPPGIAPSYFLEGLLYNVPTEKFGGSYERTMVAALNWILEADRDELACANDAYYLVRDVPHVCWKPANCDRFLNSLVGFWDGWQ